MTNNLINGIEQQVGARDNALGLCGVVIQRTDLSLSENPARIEICDGFNTINDIQKDVRQWKKCNAESEAPQSLPSSTACKICRIECQYKSWLKVHMKQYTDERISTCTTCQKSFRNNQNLQKHMVTHSDEKSICCSNCNKAFKCNSHLQQHIRLVHKPAQQLPCQICQKLFKRETLLRRHLQSQHPDTDERTYECYICKKSIISQPILRAHFYEHCRISNWLCTQCGMKFKSNKALDRHLMRVDHNGANRKPFFCQVCDRRFVDHHKLIAHGRVHSGERPFRCSVCAKCFASKSNLKQHFVVHSDKRPHECHLCDYKCKSRCNLRKHFQLHSRIID